MKFKIFEFYLFTFFSYYSLSSRQETTFDLQRETPRNYLLFTRELAIYPNSRLFSPFLQTISKNFKQRQTHGRSMKFNYSAHERNSTCILQSDVAKNRFAEYRESEELRFKLCSSRENIREKPIACIRCTLHHRYT